MLENELFIKLGQIEQSMIEKNIQSIYDRIYDWTLVKRKLKKLLIEIVDKI